MVIGTSSKWLLIQVGTQTILRARSDLDAGYSAKVDSSWDMSTLAPLRIGSYPNANTGTARDMQIAYMAGFSGAKAESLVKLNEPGRYLVDQWQ